MMATPADRFQLKTVDPVHHQCRGAEYQNGTHQQHRQNAPPLLQQQLLIVDHRHHGGDEEEPHPRQRAAQVLFNLAQTILAEMQQLEAELADLQSLQHGRLTLGIPPGSATSMRILSAPTAAVTPRWS